MRRGILVTLLVVLVTAFVVGSFYSPAEAKVQNCHYECIDGVLWECCEWTHGYYVLLRCHQVNPVTPC